MADLIFDDLVSGGGSIYFDNLDHTGEPVYLQQANGVLLLSGGGAQVYSGVHDQNVDVTLTLYGGAGQEYFPPGGAQTYVQGTTGLITLFGGALQEYLPPQIQAYTQQADGVLMFSGGALHVHFPGLGGGTEYIQTAAGNLLLTSDGLQEWLPPGTLVTQSRALAAVAGYGQSPTPVRFDVSQSVTLVSRVTLTFSSASPHFVSGIGPGGSVVHAELALRRADGSRVPLVSVTPQRPEVAFYLDPSDALGRFNALRTAILMGPVDIEVSGFEALSDRCLALPLAGSAQLTLGVTP